MQNIKCYCCPKKCGVLRTEYTNEHGFCKMPLLPTVALASVHMWEEPCISGTLGSGTVFFSGCSLKCVFCQNYEISHNKFGKTISVKRLSEIFKELEEKNVHNINLVNPTHYFYAIKEALKIYRPKIPIVYNSGGYENQENINENLFDIYLLDLKYLNRETSLKFSAAADYPDIAKNAVLSAYRAVGKPVFDDNGILKRGVIVRHLILPQHTNEAISVLKFLKKNCPDVIVSIMSQYTPVNTENFNDINRKITKREYQKVLDAAIELDFKYIYTQDLQSSGKEYIPNFNLSGV